MIDYRKVGNRMAELTRELAWAKPYLELSGFRKADQILVDAEKLLRPLTRKASLLFFCSPSVSMRKESVIRQFSPQIEPELRFSHDFIDKKGESLLKRRCAIIVLLDESQGWYPLFCDPLSEERVKALKKTGEAHRKKSDC